MGRLGNFINQKGFVDMYGLTLAHLSATVSCPNCGGTHEIERTTISEQDPTTGLSTTLYSNVTFDSMPVRGLMGIRISSMLDELLKDLDQKGEGTGDDPNPLEVMTWLSGLNRDSSIFGSRPAYAGAYSGFR